MKRLSRDTSQPTRPSSGIDLSKKAMRAAKVRDGQASRIAMVASPNHPKGAFPFMIGPFYGLGLKRVRRIGFGLKSAKITCWLDDERDGSTLKLDVCVSRPGDGSNVRQEECKKVKGVKWRLLG